MNACKFRKNCMNNSPLFRYRIIFLLINQKECRRLLSLTVSLSINNKLAAVVFCMRSALFHPCRGALNHTSCFKKRHWKSRAGQSHVWMTGCSPQLFSLWMSLSVWHQLRLSAHRRGLKRGHTCHIQAIRLTSSWSHSFEVTFCYHFNEIWCSYKREWAKMKGLQVEKWK